MNINNNARPFDEVMASTIERWKELDQNLYHGGEDGKFSLSVKGNWKLAVENYCESYHLPWVHQALTAILVLKIIIILQSMGVIQVREV